VNLLRKLLKDTVLWKAAKQVRTYYRRHRLNRRRREVMRSYDPSLFYLNIGSSRFVRKNWRLLDFYEQDTHYARKVFPEDLLDYNINLVTYPKLPISESQVDLIISAHCLEHVGDKPAQNVFNEAYRILKRGGIFRLVLPDADLIYGAYKRNDIEWFRSVDKRNRNEDWPIEKHYFKFLSAYYMGKIDNHVVRKDAEVLPKEEFFEKYHKEVIDYSDSVSGHITWFNYDKVERMARAAGFTDIHRSTLQKSISEEMRAPEFDTGIAIAFYVDIVR